MIALVRRDRNTGAIFYLAAADDGAGFVRVDSPISALLWESFDDLRRWIAGLSEDQVAQLERRDVFPAEVDIDFAGVSWCEYQTVFCGGSKRGKRSQDVHRLDGGTNGGRRARRGSIPALERRGSRDLPENLVQSLFQQQGDRMSDSDGCLVLRDR